MITNIPFPPLHMTIHDRTERLYNTLVSFGLIVDPIYKDGEMKSLHVHVSFPLIDQTTEASSMDRIRSPMQCSEVGQSVSSSQHFGDNVINFPTKL